MSSPAGSKPCFPINKENRKPIPRNTQRSVIQGVPKRTPLQICPKNSAVNKNSTQNAAIKQSSTLSVLRESGESKLKYFPSHHNEKFCFSQINIYVIFPLFQRDAYLARKGNQ